MYRSKGLKYVSIQQVKDFFVKNKYATKSEIASMTHLSLATITNILKELLDERYIEQVDDCQSTGGRKAKRYKICESFMLFGLIDLHVESDTVIVKCKIVNLDFSLVKKQVYQFRGLSVEQLIEVVEELKEQHDFQYLCLSVPAIINNGYVEKCDIEELENISLQELLEECCCLQVTIENDVNTGMLGYIRIHSVESPSVAFLYQPDNHHSGCGIYVNHAILYGATHFAGELAYLPNGTLYEQKILLKNDPLALLLRQVSSVIAIINPSLIIMYTPCVCENDFLRRIQDYIPNQHIPQFQFIKSMEEYVFEGLAWQCVENSRYKGKREVEYGK